MTARRPGQKSPLLETPRTKREAGQQPTASANTRWPQHRTVPTQGHHQPSQSASSSCYPEDQPPRLPPTQTTNRAPNPRQPEEIPNQPRRLPQCPQAGTPTPEQIQHPATDNPKRGDPPKKGAPRGRQPGQRGSPPTPHTTTATKPEPKLSWATNSQTWPPPRGQGRPQPAHPSPDSAGSHPTRTSTQDRPPKDPQTAKDISIPQPLQVPRSPPFLEGTKRSTHYIRRHSTPHS